MAEDREINGSHPCTGGRTSSSVVTQTKANIAARRTLEANARDVDIMLQFFVLQSVSFCLCLANRQTGKGWCRLSGLTYYEARLAILRSSVTFFLCITEKPLMCLVAKKVVRLYFVE